MDNESTPAISVIIPMYNAEKYIGECLDSILAQTFTDYEVIVVDDCSTDNSAKIVESYAEKFKSKIRLERLKVNSGNGGFPRNIAIQLATGEYIFCLDSDDIIKKTAFEELYSIAKKFDADVVACEKYYSFLSKKDLNKEITPKGIKFEGYVTEATLISNNLSERINSILKKDFLWALWSKIIRRSFIIENNIQMINAVGQDMVFTCCLVCSDNKYVLAPNIINFYRIRENSAWHSGADDYSKVAHKWLNSLIRGFKYFNDFLNRQPFFKENPIEKYRALEIIVQEFTGYFIRFYLQIPTYQLTEVIWREFEKFDDKDALTAYLFSRMNLFYINLFNQQQEMQKLQENLQKSVQYLKNQAEIIDSQRAEIERLKAQLQ